MQWTADSESKYCCIKHQTTMMTAPPRRRLYLMTLLLGAAHTAAAASTSDIPKAKQPQYNDTTVYTSLVFTDSKAYSNNVRPAFADFQSAKDDRLLTFSLHPSSIIAQQRRRKLHSNSTSDSHYYNHDNSDYNHALYATIPDLNDPNFENDLHLADFYAHRHLSRYERHHRNSRRLDLQQHWDGVYDDIIETIEFTSSNDYSDSFRRYVTEVESNRSLQTTILPIGGLYNNYQDIPLCQGYGTHFANVWVGSPTPQRKTVIVDTGSHYTAFPCKGCKQCGGPHHTDPYFDPEKSKSFHQLQCDECIDGVYCQEGKCNFRQSYTEGSSWQAVQVKDKFYCSGADYIDSVDIKHSKYSLDFMFGCQTSMSGLFVTQLADGIMGMAAHPATLPKQLYMQNKIEHDVFAMCFRRELGTSKHGVTAGSMTIGGFSNDLDTSPMVYAKNIAKKGWFTVYVKNIYVRIGGGQSAKSIDLLHKTIKVNLRPETLNSGKGVIVDSGTTDTYLSKAVAPEFSKAWKIATGQKYSHSPVSLTKEELLALPTILIQCHSSNKQSDPTVEEYDTTAGYAGVLDLSAPHDLLIAVPATSYMDYSPITKKYTSRIYFTETTGGVLGSNTMQGHNVVFDYENGRVGFAESTCTYDKSVVSDVAKDEGFASDCSIGEPVLSKACVDTVDKRMCAHNPTNIALLGTEVWSAVVKNAGNDIGMSCTEVAENSSKEKGIRKINVECKNGVCEEGRPCQLTCAELVAAEQVKVTTREDSHNKGCGDTFWSTCDYDCKQTRIRSQAFSDGTCHEVSRESRTCHIHACARSDPCRVPFIIHAVFAFEGLQSQSWTTKAEASFVSALASSINSMTESPLIIEGDIDVLLVAPYYRDEMRPDSNDDMNGADKAIGSKVVVDISMYNEYASVHDPSDASDDTSGISTSSIGTLLSSLSSNITVKKPKPECVSDELFNLASRTLHITNIIKDKGFIAHFLTTITDFELQFHIGYIPSPFAPLFSKDVEFLSRSGRILSIWTIRTEVDDDINYLGPPRPRWVKMLSVAHSILALLFLFLTLSAAWNAIVILKDEGFGWHGFLRCLRRYGVLSGSDLVSIIGESITDSDAESLIAVEEDSETDVELTTRYVEPHGKTQPKKRRTLLSP